jgi:hypothetical protein
MVRESVKVPIPNPHKGGSISVGLLTRILKQAGVTRK